MTALKETDFEKEVAQLRAEHDRASREVLYMSLTLNVALVMLVAIMAWCLQ